MMLANQLVPAVVIDAESSSDGKDLMELIETVTASTTQRVCEEFCYGDADEDL